jgi:NAD(P)-dependent dehydrogenase (short-subunit alcohol dehydrogenase family)
MIRTALITGAARRIGKRMAMDLAAQGWAVAIHYNSSRKEAQAVADDIAAAPGAVLPSCRVICRPARRRSRSSTRRLQNLGPCPA